ncbi:helix-turn-helix domain-containing protein [Streptomyces sp. NPDC052114]|uniref:helix-turn-helix domain-containing protein n=1 Tax=unclassified Streptomyces TaxID=2593676 RepID=UPI0034181003
MHVEDLLRLTSLDLNLLWGDGAPLAREISGVTATDLEDPTRFVRDGEVVLSGLVWWRPEDGRAKVDRFVAALATAGAAALLAGEETHGTVPDSLVDACRAHGIALASVPSHTDFRAIIDAVYLRQWGDLSRRPSGHHALPENVRVELSRLLEADADVATLLDRALAHLGAPACHLLTATGRTVARTPAAPDLSPTRALRQLTRPSGIGLRIETDATAYDSWHLYLHDPDEAPPRLLHEIADVLARHRERRLRAEADAARHATALLALLEGTAPAPDGAALRAALRACGLPEDGAYQVIAAAVGPRGASGPAAAHGGAVPAALAEAVRHLGAPAPGDAARDVRDVWPGHPPFAVGHLADGTAAAVVHLAQDTYPQGLELHDIWPLLTARTPRSPLHGGLGAPVDAPEQLARSLAQARYALTAARTATPRHGRLTRTDGMTTLGTLLAGVPDAVRTVFTAQALGPLADRGDASQRVLLHTLETYLAHNGSWARTAEALHLHVNTVHYRIQRIEALTGRDLSRLDHKLDLYAALCCRAPEDEAVTGS